MASVNIKQREKLLLVLTIVVVLGWAWKFFVLNPILDYGDKLDAELVVKNLKLREAKKIINSSPQKAATQESFKRFISGGSNQEDMTKMIKDIEAAAAQAGLKVLETKAQPQVKNVGWFELRVSISFEGRWSDVVRFFYQLENVDKPLLVNEMSLEANMPQQTSVRGRFEIGRLLTIASPDL